ncbi:MAG: hypothetical protein NZ890_17480 [Myxococcota bacterium]|nr:hypothetical protein [Myxococcota bacterium]
MQFGRWLPLPDALAAAPKGPGLYQIRVRDGLLAFPRGRSAMVAYGGGEDVAAALRTFLQSEAAQRAHCLGPLLCRFAPPDPGRSAAECLVGLLSRFVAQFGAPPPLSPSVSLPQRS